MDKFISRMLLLSLASLIVWFNSLMATAMVISNDYEDEIKPSWGRCPWIRDKLKNGRVKMRSRGRIAKFACNSGYELVGKRFATCVRGQWNHDVPICVSSGCYRLPKPSNSKVSEMYRGALLVYDCLPGYVRHGPPSLYCDGSKWSEAAPICEAATQEPAYSCDFEESDLCGWTQDPSHDVDWRRNQFITPSGHFGTGPSGDHTYGPGKAGFYMYLEASTPQKENDVARLFSPVYPPNSSPGCFVFWYHMYGQGTGGLKIYIKSESQVFGDVMESWGKDGHQGNLWLRGSVQVKEMTDNFQIVIEGVRGPNYESDIAIDDVNLVDDNCSSSIHSSYNTSAEASSDSCRGRCLEMQETGDCSCSRNCELHVNCCSDYNVMCTIRGPVSLDSDYSTERTTFGESSTKEIEHVTTKTSLPVLAYTSEEKPTETPLSTIRSSEISYSTSIELFVSSTEDETSTIPEATSTSEISLNENLTEIPFFQSPLTDVTPRKTSQQVTTELPDTPEQKFASTVVSTSQRRSFESSTFDSPTMSSSLQWPSDRTTEVVSSELSSITEIFENQRTVPASTASFHPMIIPHLSTTTSKQNSDTFPTLIPNFRSTSGFDRFTVSFYTEPSTSSFHSEPSTASFQSKPSTISFHSEPSTMFSLPENFIPTLTTMNNSASSTVIDNRESETTIDTSHSYSSRVFRIDPKQTNSELEVTTLKYRTTAKSSNLQPKRVDVISRNKESNPESGYRNSNLPPTSKSKVETENFYSTSVAGLVVVALVIAGVAAAIAIFIFRRRKHKQNKLSEDSEIKYLSDNEIIEFCESSERSTSRR